MFFTPNALLPKALFTVATLLFLCSGAWGRKGETLDKGYLLLKKVCSPQELIEATFPKSYCVPVTLSGSVAQEMNNAIENLQLEKPDYHETFSDGKFDLMIGNSSYPSQTRDLLSGILNPLELIDLIIESFVKLKSGERFLALVRETDIHLDTATLDTRPIWSITLTPKGNRFAYEYIDQGAFIQETWMSHLVITIDTVSRVVYEIRADKCKRISGTTSDIPQTDTIRARYAFSYVLADSQPLPSRLSLSVDSLPALIIEASYRRENRQFVFDNKRICSTLPNGDSSCLHIDYGTYRGGLCNRKAAAKNQSGYNKKLAKAALLSKKALDELRQGNIAASMRAMEQIVTKYGDTPQAVEARRLLESLPSRLP